MKRAGSDTARENSKVRIPLADLTRRSTRPTRNTLITRSKVGEMKKLFSNSDSEEAVKEKRRHSKCSLHEKQNSHGNMKKIEQHGKA